MLQFVEVAFGTKQPPIINAVKVLKCNRKQVADAAGA